MANHCFLARMHPSWTAWRNALRSLLEKGSGIAFRREVFFSSANLLKGEAGSKRYSQRESKNDTVFTLPLALSGWRLSWSFIFQNKLTVLENMLPALFTCFLSLCANVCHADTFTRFSTITVCVFCGKTLSLSKRVLTSHGYKIWNGVIIWISYREAQKNSSDLKPST